MELKGYKGFDKDLKCRDFQYEVGKEYKHDGKIELCDSGFHFCKRVMDIHGYYDLQDEETRVCEILASGNIIEGNDKCVTDTIKIVRELSKDEIDGMKNAGRDNTGIGNKGNRNTGNGNGGNRNTGYKNIGDWNTGNSNIGNENTGDWNIGDWNTGYWNEGKWNTGNSNIGNENTGNGNIGNGNTGDWNKTDRATGCFCTEKQPIKFFDKDSNMTWEEWQESEAYRILCRIKKNIWVDWEDMTEEERGENPKAKTTGGFIRELDLKEEAEKWWINLEDEEKEIIRAIPNFDRDKFRKIMGGAKVG